MKDLAQRIASLTDACVVNVHRWKPPFTPNVPAGVTQMIESLRDEMSDGGRGYLRIARAVETFLEERSLRGWGQLDVETFVFLRARGITEAIELCCNLSAMLPHLIVSGEMTAGEATRAWVDLFDVCPEDDGAQGYILAGLERFGDLEALAEVPLGDREDEADDEADESVVDLEELDEVLAGSGVRGLSIVPDAAVIGPRAGARLGAELLATKWASGE